MALNQDFNLPRLERCLALTWESGAQPVVIFTKSDLRENLDEKLALAAPVTLGVETLVISSIKGDTWKYVRELIRPGMTAAMIGSSGTGKSTLLNRLLGGEAIRTNGLRSDGKGRHTTTRRELYRLPDGGLIVDTPGMREFGMWDSSEGIDRR
jgi:ribosome biogenesis GTPase